MNNGTSLFVKKVIKLLRPFIITTMRYWWFVTKPTTHGAKAVIVCNDEVLLIKPTYGYNYSLPGGGVKKAEAPETAVKREVSEEVGIILDDVIPLPTFVSTAEYKNDTVHGFYSEVKTKDCKTSSVEIDSVEWHKLNNLPKLGSVTAKIIQLYKNSV